LRDNPILKAKVTQRLALLWGDLEGKKRRGEPASIDITFDTGIVEFGVEEISESTREKSWYRGYYMRNVKIA
jgi:hypothetical protein